MGGIFSRGHCSTFMWDNNSKAKFIQHDPTCNIPLIQVNESNIDYMQFINKHSDKMIDNICLLQDDVCISKDSARAIKVDKQFVDVNFQLIDMDTIPVGTIVKVLLNGNIKVCIITKEYIKGNGSQGYQVRSLNSFEHSTVDESFVEIIPPESADIPTSPNDLDSEVIQTSLVEEDLHKLYNCAISYTVVLLYIEKCTTCLIVYLTQTIYCIGILIMLTV